MTKIISHRGNIDGSNLFHENRPSQIEKMLKETAFDIEIDVQIAANLNFYLGHDKVQYPISSQTILSNKNRFWIHSKTINSFSWIIENLDLNVFYHSNEPVVLTSQGNIWFYPGEESKTTLHKKGILVLPELTYGLDIQRWRVNEYYAVCTDYPLKLEKYLNEKI